MANDLAIVAVECDEGKGQRTGSSESINDRRLCAGAMRHSLEGRGGDFANGVDVLGPFHT